MSISKIKRGLLLKSIAGLKGIYEYVQNVIKKNAPGEEVGIGSPVGSGSSGGC